MTCVSSGNSDRRRRYGEETSLEKREGLGEVQLERIPCTCRRVCVSMSLGCRMSTVSPKCARKSAPRISFCKSAIMKIHGSERRRPRLSVRERCPYVRMGVLFTACSVRGWERWRSEAVGGMTLTSEPVSTRKEVFVCASLT